jgi:hypothetical protein
MNIRTRFGWSALSLISALFALLVAFNVQLRSVSAYGGGPGLPPGLPTYNFGMVCTNKVMKLPMNLSVTVPQCKVKHDPDFNQRLRDFINRVIHGDNR